MPAFTYRAIDKLGKEISGDVEVANYNEAIERVRSLGYFPVKIIVKKSPIAGGRRTARSGVQVLLRIPLLGIGNVKSNQVTVFTRQLATLIDAGLPFVRSLNILRDQMKSCMFRNVVDDLSRQVEGGSTFSDSLHKYPKIFSKLYVNMVKAGEAGGVLEIVLKRLAEFSEKAERLHATIRGALAYPIVVVLVAIAILTFLLITVIPKFMELYNEIEAELPLPTVILLKVSNFLKNQWILGILFLIGMIVVYNLLIKFPVIRYLVDRIKLRIPVFGLLIQKVSIARFGRTLGTLISSGVPILQAIAITKDTSGNEVIGRSLGKVHDSIREGESIAGPLSKTKAFPLMVVNMISVGEETGSIDQMLNKIADTYEAEVDTITSTLTSLLEPILIVIMGIVVGSIVISVFLPLVKLLTALSI